MHMSVSSQMYAYAMLAYGGLEAMPRAVALVRKSFFVEPRALRRAKRVLGVRTEAEVVRRSIEQVVEQEEFWRFMTKSGGRLARGSFESA
jgi:hypothetical protein